MNTKQNALLTILLVIGAFVIGNLISQDFSIKSFILSITSSSRSFESIPIQNQQVPTQNVVKRASETIIKKVGDSFVLWDMQYQVLLAVNKGSKLGMESTTGKFIALKIKVTNEGKSEAGLNKIYLQDNKGRKYDNKIGFYSDFAGKDSLTTLNNYGMPKNYNGIPAGFSETFLAVFEVPKDSSGLVLKYPSAEGFEVLAVNLGL